LHGLDKDVTKAANKLACPAKQKYTVEYKALCNALENMKRRIKNADGERKDVNHVKQ
jgi:hypothetical protein